MYRARIIAKLGTEGLKTNVVVVLVIATWRRVNN